MRGVASAAAALLLAACSSPPVGPVTIQTMAENPVCAAARVAGVLVADPHYGLAFKADGGVRGVVWPYGYSARRESDGIVVLIDPAGVVVAREGDRIDASGAVGAEGVAFAQCELHKVRTGAE